MFREPDPKRAADRNRNRLAAGDESGEVTGRKTYCYAGGGNCKYLCPEKFRVEPSSRARMILEALDKNDELYVSLTHSLQRTFVWPTPLTGRWNSM